MVLSDKEILGIQDGATSFITPFDESRLRAASYDVSLDGEITALLERADVLDLSNQDAVDLIYSTKRGLEEFILKPCQYCLAALNEIITLPDNIVARVMPRTRFTRLGLLVAPQFCNPSYSGRLQIGILNASGNNTKLAPKMGIAQLVLSAWNPRRPRAGYIAIRHRRRTRTKMGLLVSRQTRRYLTRFAASSTG